VIVTSDGRVYTNVGYGWEPVVEPLAPGASASAAAGAPSTAASPGGASPAGAPAPAG